MMRTPVLMALAVAAIAAVPALAADEPVIGQKEKLFTQEEVTIPVNGTVLFVNDDNITHNLTVHEPDDVTRPGVVQQPGAESRFAFDKFGDYVVRCLIHPKMKMTVHSE